ncbi:uncharacterized protein A1O9_10483 [Exophiala aquamarina CBS 119918]|uniref:Carboxylesterase type B domain-containing protein n=1 Tax=Exophiala aquamarina CBS 119918 TaxID=1182545 RepID=A0A072P2K5_9EURO|nr:uncharacterized protein A1O9_10483 [Exophiala aquamarina CBS 119918]KEF53508.1 hypothetical protein A1O9_10483 [Exophiala aquamarina CBS 119918]
MPMISVGVNYRVGMHGFLYSPEMETARYKPNNGLDDQRLALRWVQRNIAGFGGDPGRVTFIGESAGAASGCYHLHSKEALFHQYISMSGSSLLRPRRLELLEKSFKSIVSELGVSNAAPALQIEKLLEPGNANYLAKFARQYSVGPIVDGDIIPSVTTYQSLVNPADAFKMFPGINHCKRILVGGCQFDGMIWNSRLAGRTDVFPKTLAQHLDTILDPIDIQLAPAIISGYDLAVAATVNTPETTLAVLKLGNDICFAQATSTLAQTWAASGVPGSKAFLYHFNCPNPWDGPWKGEATHGLDIVFALQNYREHLSIGQRRSTERLAKDIITFVNGNEPWQGYDLDKPTSMIYFAEAEGWEDKSELVDERSLEHTRQRSVLHEVASKGALDKVMDAWQMFMRGP